MSHRLLTLVSLLALAACDKNVEPEGAKPEPISATGGASTSGTNTDPHAGMNTADPHAGMNMEGAGGSHGDPAMADPHGGMGANPHGGATAPADPAMALDGEIVVAPKLAAQVKTGDIIFVAARKADEKGQAIGGPIGVARLDVTSLPMPFRLDGNNVMMLGAGKFEGPIVLTARIDRDGEARTREAGDIEGRLSATIPQKGLKLVLDTPVQ